MLKDMDLTEEEKMILFEKYSGFEIKEIDKIIEIHNKEHYKLLKNLKCKENRKKYYNTLRSSKVYKT